MLLWMEPRLCPPPPKRHMNLDESLPFSVLLSPVHK